MYIAPDSKIYLLTNVPLDNKYEHTIWFNSSDDQYRYFNSLAIHRLDNQSYQRKTIGVARVAVPADDLYTCNYMMFQNSSFGSKWFYAFVTQIEYVNNQTADIYFEIDVMQTWLFNYQFNEAYVARMHSYSDNIGDNILPEPVSCGEYVMDSYKEFASWNNHTKATRMDEFAIVIAVVDTQGSSQGHIYDKIYGGATLYAFDGQDSTSVNGFLTDRVQQNNSIIGMYMCPKWLISSGNFESSRENPFQLGDNTEPLPDYSSLPAVSTSMTLNGYKPRNKKLYTYPYNFCHVDNSNGESLAIRYEFCNNMTPSFVCYATQTQPVQVVLRPTYYKGSGLDGDPTRHAPLNTESLSIGNYPLCSWNFDAYQAWVAQNSIPLAAQGVTKLGNYAISGILSGGAGFVTGIPNLLSTAESYMEQDYRASIASDISRGNFQNGGANCSNGIQSFYGGQCSITAQYARMIDDFFDRFGYATNRLVSPNRSFRPHWNYLQTVGCTIEGSVPADDMRKICDIYDAGITFWKHGSEVGNYSLDNRI